ncbi:RHS repeat-associated core domain-containing protein [Kitasatospora sp. NPDC004669]|uniref:RHS repeat-associated core domain-containing protein n=1 Tax=Kitasatospora sp. NPDC004669 TaxID=3154555 RepID=UPI00339E3AB3
MSNPIVKALQHSAQKLGKTLADDAGKAMKGFYHKTGNNLKQVAHNTRQAEARHAAEMDKLLKGGGKDMPHPGSGSGARSGDSHPKGRGRDQASDPRTEGRAHDSRCGGGEPVDMATGRMYIDQVDASLPGSLPLLFTRNFESGYIAGRWMGPKWVCTFDERLEIDAEGVVHIRADRITQAYPHPNPGETVEASAGERRQLRLATGGYHLRDHSTGLTREFTIAAGGTEALLTRVRDRHGRHYTLAYDEDGVPQSITHSGGYELRVTVDADRITALRLANATETGGEALLLRYSYTDGHLSAVYNSSGKPMRFANDVTGRILSWTDRNDSRYLYTYDHLDRVVDEGGADGALRFHFTYGSPDPETGLRTHTETNALGHTTAYLVNDDAQITAQTDPLGNTTTYERDEYDRLLTETDPLGRTTHYEYDGAGDLVRITRPDGRRSTATYHDRLSLLESIIEPGGATWLQAYDDNGLRSSLTDPLGATTHFAYDEHGHLATVTDALGQTTLVRCSAAGLPLEITDPTGGTTHLEYDAFGRRVTVTDALGSATRTTWTVEGFMASRVSADGSAEAWAYDGEGNLLSHTDELGRITTFEYTHFESLAARTGPDGARLAFAYDADMQLTTVTDALGHSWSYAYDAAGRLVEERDFHGRTISYRLDGAGQLICHVNPLGQETHYTYDVLGRTTTLDANGLVSTYSYDDAGHLIQASNQDAVLIRTVDALGNVLTESVNGHAVTRERDSLGRVTRRTTPSGHVSSWHYAASGQPISLETTSGSLSFAYDALGRELTRTVGGRLELTSTWDVRHRLTSQTLRGLEAVVQGRAYSYRADGHLVGIDDHLAGPRTFNLDSVGRITGVQAVGRGETYRYNASGDLVEADWPATGATRASLGSRVFDGTQLAAAGRVRYEHDAAGRTTLRQVTRLSRKPDTWHYRWDAGDRLTDVITPDGTRWHYLYDPLGRRIAKQRLASDRTTVVEQSDFAWDGSNLTEQTTRAPYLPGPHTLTWDHNGVQPIAQSEAIDPGGVAQQCVDRRFFAIVTDLVGTPTELVDPATATVAWRAVSTLWGHTTWPRDSATYTPLRFPGQYFDAETRLHYNVHRYYDPETARYITPDPLGLVPAPNPDTYVHNPLTWTDPLGLSPHRTRPRIENGNEREGWQHIDERHISGTSAQGHGDLMPPTTTRAHVQAAVEKVVKRGQRISDPGRRMQLYEKRMTVNGMSARYRVLVDSHDGNRVVTFFPVGKSYRP